MARNSPGYVIQILLRILKKYYWYNLIINKDKNISKRRVLNFKRLIIGIFYNLGQLSDRPLSLVQNLLPFIFVVHKKVQRG